MTWTTPTHVVTGTADSSKFNTETVDNLIDHESRIVTLRTDVDALQDAVHAAAGSGTTDASGNLTVTHGAGFTPTAVIVTPKSPASGTIFGQVVAHTFTSTQFTIRCFSQTGTALNAVAITFSYVCHA